MFITRMQCPGTQVVPSHVEAPMCRDDLYRSETDHGGEGGGLPLFSILWPVGVDLLLLCVCMPQSPT